MQGQVGRLRKNLTMLGAYNWAFVKPIRKLYYNMTITAVSIIVALVIGGIETLALVQGTFDLSGPFWDFVSALNNHFGMLGYLIIGIFIASWMVSVMVYRLRRYDEI
jgi:high-affinity nickel-transport protein